MKALHEKIHDIYYRIINRINNFTKYDYALIVIFTVGILVRILGISECPKGLNQDEASAAYDAYSILNYGIDRNGNSYPVFLVAWGSGQNALYSYIMIPFIKIFGLKVFAARLPMALIGCLSLVVVYIIGKECFNRKYAIVITFFIAICPWHIMKSRWGLESNVFPDLVLYCVLFIIMYMKKNKKRYFYIAAFILGLSSYSYGTAYMFIPVFALFVIIVLLRNKLIDWGTLIISGIIAFVTALPILMFVIINTFDMNQLSILGFTIPKLYVSRHMEMSSFFSKNFLECTIQNFENVMNIMLNQNDGLIWNGFDYFGIIYIISMPFAIIGLYVTVRTNCHINKSNHYEKILNCMIVAAALVSIAVNPNINRINILVLPIAIYTGIGIAYICMNLRSIRGVVIGMYMMLFFAFISRYFSSFNDDIKDDFFYSYGDAIRFTHELNVDKVYITSSINMPYIFTLFYDRENPYEYINSVEFTNPKSAFEYVESYGKYIFFLPYDYCNMEKSAIIVNNDEIENYDLNYYHVKKFDLYSVLFVD